MATNLPRSASSSPEGTVRKAAAELESIRNLPKYDGISFPENCRRLLVSIPGNGYCVDCGTPNPTWASLSYGALLCLSCSGRHRSYGVQTSFVRSVDMDTWSHSQILTLLEGGNQQLDGFFNRHKMGQSTPICNRRYHTKAAKFYRENLPKHVQNVAQQGLYRGRDVSRSLTSSQASSCASSASSSSSCPDGSNSDLSSSEDELSVSSNDQDKCYQGSTISSFESIQAAIGNVHRSSPRTNQREVQPQQKLVSNLHQ